MSEENTLTELEKLTLQKEAIGLPKDTARAAAAAQLAEDKFKPSPAKVATNKARSCIDLANASIRTATAHIAQAEKARAEAVELNAEVELPALSALPSQPTETSEPPKPEPPTKPKKK